MKAHNYREVKGAPYTRNKYMRGPPQSKIVKFTMGEPSSNHSHQLSLVAKRRVQIQHNALEAARIAANRYLEEKLGQNFYLRILLFPHVVLRENKMLTRDSRMKERKKYGRKGARKSFQYSKR